MQLAEILNDRQHGSRYLTKQLLKYLLKMDNLDSELFEIQKKVLAVFEDMQSMRFIFNELEYSQDKRKTVRLLLEKLEKNINVISDKFKKYVSSRHRLLSFSHSQTVIDVLNKVAYDQIFCMISSPGDEGKIMAQVLDGTLITDDTGFNYLDDGKVDAVVIGADSYTEKGSVINKVGSKKLVDKSFENKVPVYILVSSLKIAEHINKPSSELLEKFEILENCHIVHD